MTPKPKNDRLAWFKMDAGAFIADTMGLSNNDVGIYAKLTMLYWASGNQLPQEEGILKRKTGITSNEDSLALDSILNEFFPINEQGIRVNNNLDRQLEEIKEISQKQSRNGKLAHVQKSSFTNKVTDEEISAADF